MSDDVAPKVEVPFPVPQILEVDLMVYGKVKLTQELCDGIADQYPDFWDRSKDDPEELARAVLYAFLGHLPPYATKEDYWDGVACLDGLIMDVELE